MRPRVCGLLCATLALMVAPGADARAAAAPPPTSVARLQGFFVLSGRVTVADNVNGERGGEPVQRTWGFVPLCPAGACASVELVRNRAGGQDKLILSRRAPGYYVGTGSFYAPLRCAKHVYRRGEAVPFTIAVRIIATELVGITTVALDVQAAYVNTARTNLTPCVAAPSHDAAFYLGTLMGAGQPRAPAGRRPGLRSPAGS